MSTLIPTQSIKEINIWNKCQFAPKYEFKSKFSKLHLFIEHQNYNSADVQRMRSANVHGFLVGEAFMTAAEPGGELEKLFA